MSLSKAIAALVGYKMIVDLLDASITISRSLLPRSLCMRSQTCKRTDENTSSSYVCVAQMLGSE